MTLFTEDYKLFDTADFKNITGKSLDAILERDSSGNPSDYMIIYTSIFINSYISRLTGGRKIFKTKDTNSPNNYIYSYGFTSNTAFKLTKRQEEALKLACVYQCDYFIDNGSAERISGLSISSRTAVLSKNDLVSYQVCDVTRALLAEAGFLYAGIGSGMNAWSK